MSVFEPNSCHLRKVLIFCFYLKKTAAESHRMLLSTYGETALSERTCREVVSTLQERWFWCRGPAWWWKREHFWRFRIGGITCWTLVPTQGPVKIYLETLKWEVLHHPTYSPDVAPSDYHLFRSMAHGLAHQHFRSYKEVKKWIDLWITSKDASFFRDGIRPLPERWKK